MLSTTVFNPVIAMMSIPDYMVHFKARFVKVRERFYIILGDLGHLSDTDISQDTNLPFDVTNDAELEERRQVACFQAVSRYLKVNRL